MLDLNQHCYAERDSTRGLSYSSFQTLQNLYSISYPSISNTVPFSNNSSLNIPAYNSFLIMVLYRVLWKTSVRSSNSTVMAPLSRITTLAPEHRLPAAIEDGLSVMKWLQAQALGDCDGWLDTCEVDFSRVFVMDDSCSANIAHHLAVKFHAESTALASVRV
ncbi:hypothetical protein EZV62_010882 [Acer yangbiense]|uniref:Alpha/beta hydrolase fold-3 domain-containing protein n=1 Tax=Acer yangbiense TaxID=1000413 RepID=A0A5C7I4F8_9ROSI|nr:hypothetical protein EZV62_010882 [Acer yangbiense]